jgi:hypothetical protein
MDITNCFKPQIPLPMFHEPLVVLNLNWYILLTCTKPCEFLCPSEAIKMNDLSDNGFALNSRCKQYHERWWNLLIWSCN